MKKLIFIFTFIFGLTYLYPQSLDILGINSSKYPKMTMEFRVKDNKNKEVRTFGNNDFQFSDSACKNIKNFLIDCQGGGSCKLSFIFTLDKSPTMFENFPGQTKLKYEVAKQIFLDFLSQLDPGAYEAAVVSFWGNVKLQLDFTSDINKLKLALDSVYRFPLAQTNFNAGLLSDCYNNPGALKVAERAKYKPVVILLTDGLQNYSNTTCSPSQNLVNTGAIISAAAALSPPATIGTITINDVQDPALCQIAQSTPLGNCILSQDEGDIRNWLAQIVAELCTIAPPPPCTVNWEACCEGGNVSLTYNPFSLTKQATYSVNDSLKPYLEINPVDPYFFNVEPGQTKQQLVTVTARRNYVKFDSLNPVIIGNPKFTIKSPPILNGMLLKKDASITLNVEYKSADSGYARTNITFNSTACNGNNWNSTAGWIFLRNVHLGSGVLNQPTDKPVVGVLCNFSGKPITINKMYPNQGDFSEFEIINPKPPFDLPTDSCLTVTFRFTPTSEGLRKTTLVAETSEGKFYSDLTGDGSGYPNIKITPKDSIVYPNSNCKAYNHDTTITITNIGALALDINSINLSNAIDFEQIGWPSIPFTVQPATSKPLVVRFNPKSIGQKTCVMTINSNSKYSSTYNIYLSGTRDSIGFTVTKSNVDFGQVCPDETVTQTIKLNNTGTIPITVTVADAGNFKVAPNSWTIPTGGPQDITISFTSNIENIYNANLVFTDDYCNFTNTVSVKAEVVTPKISYSPLVITSVVGDKKQGTIRITNTSTRNLTITSDNVPCSEMKILTTTPWNIPAGGFIDVVVEYSPLTDKYLECFIKLFGNECNFKDSIKVEGNPNLATATIQIEKYSGYAGFPITIPVNLRNLNKIVESGVTGFNTKIKYDQNLLTYQSITNGSVNVNSGFIDVSNILVSGLNGDILTNITFMVNISNPSTTVLDLSETTPVGGSIKVTESDGEFTLNITSAEIYIDNLMARTGETITIPVKISNPINFNAVHKNIITTLSYNYTLLEPIGSTPNGNIVNDKRVIELVMPYKADANGVLQNFQFKAMLGTAQSTALELNNSHVAAGSSNLTEKSGSFKISNICISADANNPNPRLFDPKGKAQIINISPNPANGETTIDFEAQEDGYHSISLYSQVGKLIMNIVNQNLKSGIHEVTLNTEYIASGAYYLIYQTPTKIITEPIGILK